MIIVAKQKYILTEDDLNNNHNIEMYVIHYIVYYVQMKKVHN